MPSQAPPNSRVQLIESSANRAVLIISPGGKRARSMGCFALMWLTIVGAVTGIFIAIHLGGGENVDGEAPPPWAIALFAFLFWGVGLGMAYIWIRMRFTRYLIAAEPHQLSVQRQLFGKKKTSITTLDENSIASLKESYSENNVPVYCIQVQGAEDDEKFGTALDLPEKQWIIDTINKVIHPTAKRSVRTFSDDPYCDACGTMLLNSSVGKVCPDCGKVFQESDLAELKDDLRSADFDEIGERIEPLDPTNLPPESLLRIDQQQVDALKISYPVVNSIVRKIIIGGLFGAFGLAWSGFAASFLVEVLNGFQLVTFLISLVFFGAGLLPVGVAMVISFGRVRVTVNRDQVTARAGFGPVGYGRSVTTDSIERVVLSCTMLSQQIQSQRQTSERMSQHKPCIVYSSERNLTLTSGMNRAMNQEMCGLVVFQLTRMGYRV